jgi:hypothetical protein
LSRGRFARCGGAAANQCARLPLHGLENGREAHWPRSLPVELGNVLEAQASGDFGRQLASSQNTKLRLVVRFRILVVVGGGCVESCHSRRTLIVNQQARGGAIHRDGRVHADDHAEHDE